MVSATSLYRADKGVADYHIYHSTKIGITNFFKKRLTWIFIPDHNVSLSLQDFSVTAVLNKSIRSC